MAAVGHFGCPKITFDLISGHFRSIRNFNFCWNFWQNGWRRPFWMSEIHFWSHFWPFQQLYFFLAIYATLFFFWNFRQNGCRRPFWMSEIHFPSHFWSFQIDTQLNLFLNFFTKWPTSAILDVRNSLSIAFLAISDPYGTLKNVFYKMAAILDGTTMSIIELVRDIWMSNACDKFEEPSKVIALTTKLRRGGGGCRCGGCVADENIIFPKTYVFRDYNYAHNYSMKCSMAMTCSVANHNAIKKLTSYISCDEQQGLWSWHVHTWLSLPFYRPHPLHPTPHGMTFCFKSINIL